MLNGQQILVAKYLYDPFGNILSKSGPLADANTYRFSSQECHQPSGLSLYLYRAYDANLQRWLNRDPIGELGGMNLFTFAANNPPNRLDLWGLDHNIVSRASCDLCREGPKLGTATKTLRDLRWHVWGRFWQKNYIQIFIPDTHIPMTDPYHIPFSGGYWIIAGGWVVVDATCGVPNNAWTLSDFVVEDWPSIGPDMRPSVKCKYIYSSTTASSGASSGGPVGSVPANSISLWLPFASSLFS